ncbi:MAG TPA: Holliday junction branch migration protein RuvA [Verrucomicrobiae bacterium]|nr:Holliday junction branch migration protein RuvA [Verrucomicrobiae bacterium]
MLGSLSGIVTARLDNRILLEVNGVGYWVHTGTWQPDGEVQAYLYHQVREDAQVLYGFADIPTLALFERLLTVNGVGPKAALAILSLGSIDRVEQAIRMGDAGFLSLAPGIGAKAAQKIILELRGKLPETTEQTSGHNDIMAALESLGYKAADINPILKQLPTDIKDLNEQIRWVLKNISR